MTLLLPNQSAREYKEELESPKPLEEMTEEELIQETARIEEIRSRMREDLRRGEKIIAAQRETMRRRGVPSVMD